MIRSTLIAIALALAATAPIAGNAEAGKTYKHKLCKAEDLTGKKITFKCKIDQRCCYSKLLNVSKCGDSKSPIACF